MSYEPPPFVETLDTPDGPIRVHFSYVKPRRVVPAAERHRWSRIPQRGETARCIRCGCVKCYRLDYNTVYRLAGSREVLAERPACTGGGRHLMNQNEAKTGT